MWATTSAKPTPLSAKTSSRRSSLYVVRCGLRELRERIDSVANTKKITEAMKLVAAAKVRRAQEAVVSGRPFSEALVDVLFNINEQLQTDDIDVPLTRVRPVKKVRACECLCVFVFCLCNCVSELARVSVCCAW
jgi:F-type H+-transporting ATPase subunit gamma